MALKRFHFPPTLSLPAKGRSLRTCGHGLQQILRCLLPGFLAVGSLLLLLTGYATTGSAANANEVLASESLVPTTVIKLQSFRTMHAIEVQLPDGTIAKITLINLNPRANQWYVLQLSRNGASVSEEYHLENPYPETQHLVLDKKSPDSLLLTQNGESIQCPSWKLFGDSELIAARKSRQAFAPLCDGKLYLLNPTKGHRTAIESVTDFLRDNMPGGESLVGFVKDTFYQDAYREKTRTTEAQTNSATDSGPGFPKPAEVDPSYADSVIVPSDLGIQVEKTTAGMLTGHWYAVNNNPGIFVSLIQPKAIASTILASNPKRVMRLDQVEAGSLVYLVAFDLDLFDLGFAVGTEHPRVGWSERVLQNMRVPSLPGPDGIGDISPLVPSGMINPVKAARTVATFTGGFKRSHGAFKYGEFAQQNRGTHYGFVENGVILSRLQPGLATLLVRDNGDLEMKTWSDADNQDLGGIIQARQNGVPLIEWNPDQQKPVPGRLVTQWGPGNWSGSANNNLRTLRAGVALQRTDGKQFLIYGYFSTATPSAMARVFQAYGCSYAMHLDMNALEHTYLALYLQEGKHLLVRHLIQGMSVLDKSTKGTYIPRFLGYPDNRDFFYLMKRQQKLATDDK